MIKFLAKIVWRPPWGLLSFSPQKKNTIDSSEEPPMASNSNEPNVNSLEEVQKELARVLAELQKSTEQNRKMVEEAKTTQDTLSDLKRELESVKSNKKHRHKIATSPSRLDFSDSEEKEDDLSPTGEGNPKRLKLETITALRSQKRQFMKILSNLPGAQSPLTLKKKGDTLDHHS